MQRRGDRRNESQCNVGGAIKFAHSQLVCCSSFFFYYFFLLVRFSVLEAERRRKKGEKKKKLQLFQQGNVRVAQEAR